MRDIPYGKRMLRPAAIGGLRGLPQLPNLKNMYTLIGESLLDFLFRDRRREASQNTLCSIENHRIIGVEFPLLGVDKIQDRFIFLNGTSP